MGTTRKGGNVLRLGR